MKIKPMIKFLLLSFFASLSCIFGLNEDNLQHITPPTSLQKKLDSFFLKHKEYFTLDAIKKPLRDDWQKISSERVQDSEKIQAILAQIKNHILPRYEQLAHHLNQNNCQILKNDEKTFIFTSPEFPEYICKIPGSLFTILYANRQHNILRIDGAQLIKNVIQENNFNEHIYVPTKYLYHLPEHNVDLNDNNYIVIAEKIALEQKKSFKDISLQQFDALLTTVLATGYDDIHTDNIVFDTHNRLIVIDTEDFISCNEQDIISYIEDYQNNYSVMPRELLLAYVFLTNNVSDKKTSALMIYKNLSMLHSMALLKGLDKEKESCFNNHLSKLVDDIKVHTYDIDVFDQEIFKVQKNLELRIPIEPIEKIFTPYFL